jgi:beta-lactamase superfamily II metal-dependent hydrolase
MIISLGAGNTYGHSHPHSLDRISPAGTQHLFRMDVDGIIITITANSSSSEYSIVTEKSMKKTFDVSKFETACCSLQ